MDLFIYKGEEFFGNGKLDILVFQKQENKYMYIPSKSGHLKHTIRNLFWASYVDMLDAPHKNSAS